MLRSYYSLILFFIVSVGFTQNLITNGDAELPILPISGWNTASGNWQNQNFNPGSYPPPQNGTYYFFPGQNASAELFQDIILPADITGAIDLGFTTFNFSGYTRSYQDPQLDQSRIVIEFRDASNNLIFDMYDSGNVTSVGSPPSPNESTDGWLQLTASNVYAPAGTRRIRVRLISTRLHGSDNDGYYDNLTLEAVCRGGVLSLANNNPICEGDNNTLQLQNYAGAVQWQRSYNSGPFVDFGSGNATQTDAPTYADTAALYRAEVTIGNCTAYSDTIEIALSNIIGGNTSTSTTTVCQNTAMDVSVTGQTGTSIQWQVSTDNVTFSNFGSGISPQPYTPTGTGTYYFRAETSNALGCSAYSDTSSINVIALPAGGTINSGTGAICLGEQMAIDITGEGGAIQWQESTNGGSSWSNLGAGNTSEVFTPSTTNTVYRAEIGSGTCLNYSNTLIPTINPAADAGTLTMAPNPICDGDNAGMNLDGYVATNFQWQQSVDAGTTWTNFGPDDDTTTVSPGIAQSPVSYRAIATNGSCSDTSTVETLIINSGAAAGTANITNNTICEGETTTLNLVGETGNIEWFISTNGGSSWTSTGETTNTVNVTPTQSATPYQYRANVTSGSCGEISNIVQLTVLPNITSGNITSDVAQTCDGNTLELTLTGNGGNTISWQKSTDNGTSWASFGGSTNTQTDSPPVSTPNLLYRAVVSDATCNAFTNQLTHTVNPKPQKGIINLVENQVCEGQDIEVFITGNNGTLEWQKSNNANGTWTSTGITTNTYIESSTLINSPLEYRALHTLGSCIDTSDVVQVTVNPSPVAGSISAGSTSMCEHETNILTLTGASGVIYWQQSTDGGASWNSTGTGTDTLILKNLNAGTLNFRAVLEIGTCYDTTNTVAITIAQSPSNEPVVVSDTEICEGESIAASLNLSAGAIEAWEASLNNGTSWITGGPPLTQIDFTPPHLGYPVLFRAIKTMGGCRDTTTEISIIVHEAATAGTITPDNASICEGDNSTLELTGYDGILSWESSPNNGASWSTNGNTSEEQETTTLTTGSYDFRVIVTLGNCTDTSNTASIVINASPDAGNISTTNNNICEGESIMLNLNNNAGTISTWQRSINNGFSWTDVGTPSSPVSLTPPYQSFPILYRSISENGSCYDTTSNISITVNRSPSVGVVSLFDDTICEDDIGQAFISATVGNIRWQESVDGVFWSNRIETIPILNIIPDFNVIRHFRAIAENSLCRDTSNTVTLTTISPEASLLTGPSIICQNTNINLNQLLGGTSTNYWEFSYDSNTWTVFDNNTTSSTHNPGAISTTISYRIIADTLGCRDTSNTKSVSLLELVNDPITINGPTNVCLGDIATFNVPPVSNASSYIWSSNHGTELFSTGGISNIRFDTGTLDTVKVYAENSCGPGNEISYPISLYPYPDITITPDQTVCEGDTVFLSFTENSGLDINLMTARWSYENNYSGRDLTDTATATGKYKVLVTYDFQCSTSDSTELIFQDVQISAPPIIYAQKEEWNTINATSNGNWTYSWTPATVFTDASILTPEFWADQEFTARLIATSPELCSDTAYTEIIVIKDLEVPNVFTPNGDSDNELWKIEGIELLSTFVLRVYNRWGNMVYENIGEYIPWDGTRNGQKLPVATYYYVIESPDLKEPYQGSVTIVR